MIARTKQPKLSRKGNDCKALVDEEWYRPGEGGIQGVGAGHGAAQGEDQWQGQPENGFRAPNLIYAVLPPVVSSNGVPLIFSVKIFSGMPAKLVITRAKHVITRVTSSCKKIKVLPNL